VKLLVIWRDVRDPIFAADNHATGGIISFNRAEAGTLQGGGIWIKIHLGSAERDGDDEVGRARDRLAAVPDDRVEAEIKLVVDEALFSFPGSCSRGISISFRVIQFETCKLMDVRESEETRELK
jgi:hypothetical protein